MIKIKLETRVLEVKKLPLGKYAELFKALKKLPEQLQVFTGIDRKDAFKLIPFILGDSMPDFLNILKIATDVTDEELNNGVVGLNEGVDIFVAIIEVNQFQSVFEKIKKATARFQSPEKVIAMTGSTS